MQFVAALTMVDATEEHRHARITEVLDLLGLTGVCCVCYKLACKVLMRLVRLLTIELALQQGSPVRHGVFRVSKAQPTLDAYQGCSLLVSGGERKRLSIAEVMLHRPKVVFVDEYTRSDPASGMIPVCG